MSHVVLLTGGSGNLGKLMARLLSANGFIVYAGARRLEEEPNPVCSVLNDRIQMVKLDVTSEEECLAAVDYVIDREGHLDVLINNAAMTLNGPVECFSDEDYINILQVNAIAPFRLIKAVLPHMKKVRKGRIINITSLNGLLALPNFSLYSSSKFALEGMGLSLRYELKKHNIWVTNVEPGAISRLESSVPRMQHVPVREKFPLLGKLLPMLTGEDVAESVLSLINDPKPPAQLMLGRDTKITLLLHRILPQLVWDGLMSYIWVK